MNLKWYKTTIKIVAFLYKAKVPIPIGGRVRMGAIDIYIVIFII